MFQKSNTVKQDYIPDQLQTRCLKLRVAYGLQRREPIKLTSGCLTR